MVDTKVVRWEIKMSNGDMFVIGADEFNRLMKNMGTRGGNHAKWQLDDQTYIFMQKISSIKPLKFERIEIKEEQELEQAEEPVLMTQENMLQKMVELSSCTHDNKSLYFKETKTGRKYFPVCDKCFRPSRFIKAESVGEDELANAKEWVDKE